MVPQLDASEGGCAGLQAVCLQFKGLQQAREENAQHPFRVLCRMCFPRGRHCIGLLLHKANAEEHHGGSRHGAEEGGIPGAPAHEIRAEELLQGGAATDCCIKIQALFPVPTIPCLYGVLRGAACN